MERQLLHTQLAHLAFRYLAASDEQQADQILADLDSLTRTESGDYYVVFERVCDYIAEHQAIYLEPLSMEEVLAWLNE